MKVNFTTHAVKFISVYFGIEIEISRDYCGVRYRASNYAPTKETNQYGRVSRWQEIKYDGDRPFFVFRGGKEYLDEYMKVDWSPQTL